MKPLLILIACAPLLAGQSAPADRQKATDYPVSASSEHAGVGAEFLVHSIPSQRGYYYAKSYLVVDVGAFPKPGTFLRISAGQFTLRINGRTPLLVSQTPGMVASSLKYADSMDERGLSVGGGIGGVTAGTDPRTIGRFPGDPRGTTRVESSEAQDDVDSQITLAALPDTASDRPSRGCVFFASDIKVKKIKSLELEWNGPGGERVVLKLR